MKSEKDELRVEVWEQEQRLTGGAGSRTVSHLTGLMVNKVEMCYLIIYLQGLLRISFFLLS